MNRTALVQKIRSSIEDASEPPWFPNLTSDLVQSAWKDLKRKTGLERVDYSTAKVLIPNFGDKVERVNDQSPISIEFLPLEIQQTYLNHEVRFFTPGELKINAVLSCVSSANKVIKSIPSLWSTIIALVKSLHLINSKDDEYDVSFSEPNLPFSIFISVPNGNDWVSAMRVAEAVVHEGMHLQLTLINQVLPLANQMSPNLYYSPWKSAFRPASSILHALYVFSVVMRMFDNLSNITVKSSVQSEFLNKRKSQICSQVTMFQDFAESKDLTAIGRILAKRLIPS